MINMLRTLIFKVDSKKYQLGNISRDRNTKKVPKEILEIKNTVTEIKNTFDRLINRLNTAEERISKLEDITIETSKTEMQREENWEKTQNIQEL